jgi:hypothetical protein
MCNLGPNLTRRKEKHVVYGFQPIKGIFNHPFSVLPKNLRVQDCESKVFKDCLLYEKKNLSSFINWDHLKTFFTSLNSGPQPKKL